MRIPSLRRQMVKDQFFDVKNNEIRPTSDLLRQKIVDEYTKEVMSIVSATVNRMIFQELTRKSAMIDRACEDFVRTMKIVSCAKKGLRAGKITNISEAVQHVIKEMNLSRNCSRMIYSAMETDYELYVFINEQKFKNRMLKNGVEAAKELSYNNSNSSSTDIVEMDAIHI